MHGLSYTHFLTLLDFYAFKTFETVSFLLALGTIMDHKIRRWLKKLGIGAGRHED